MYVGCVNIQCNASADMTGQNKGSQTCRARLKLDGQSAMTEFIECVYEVVTK